MIEIIVNAETYLYNAYHMTKAFYPNLEVHSQVEEKASNYVRIKLPEDEILISQEEISLDGIWESRQKKKVIDRLLYRKLSEYSGKELAWGMLMGVRPTKLAYDALEKGKTKDEFLKEFTETTFASKEKAELAWGIVGREKKLLDQLDYKDGYSLYIGIPFCPSVCSYCSFSSGPLSMYKDRVESYVDTLIKELTFVAEQYKSKKLNTIYIGGGTPTTLEPYQMERLLTAVDRLFSRDYLLEYTVEAGRPDSISREKLEVIKKHEVTRISINPQTMQQKTLDAIGRKHTVEDIRIAFRMARELGFDNINMDIIAGLSGETPEDMKNTLEEIGKLDPDNLTVHSLAIKRAAKLGQEIRNKEYELDRNADYNRTISEMINASRSFAAAHDLYPYYLYRQKNIAGNFENVGYAKVDKAGIYNILIMEEKQTIVAVGAGASTKIVLRDPILTGSKKNKLTKLLRQENVKAIDAYISRIDEMIERKGEVLWR